MIRFGWCTISSDVRHAYRGPVISLILRQMLWTLALKSPWAPVALAVQAAPYTRPPAGSAPALEVGVVAALKTAANR